MANDAPKGAVDFGDGTFKMTENEFTEEQVASFLVLPHVVPSSVFLLCPLPVFNMSKHMLMYAPQVKAMLNRSPMNKILRRWVSVGTGNVRNI